MVLSLLILLYNFKLNVKKSILLISKLSALSLFFLFLAQSTLAQLSVRKESDIVKMVNTVLVGGGVTVDQIIFRGDTAAIGIFNGLNSNLGLDSGIIISTGRAADAAGANDKQVSTSNNRGPDIDLQSISDGATVDAASLEFDFVPSSTSIRFRFVFGSEEYPEFVGQAFNDVFGFFISGPGYNGKENIALIPGTNTAISIATVNHVTNNNYYIDNTNGTTVQYDAFTTIIEIVANVEACKTYTLKFAISDVIDRAYDSGIFIEAGSLKSENSDAGITVLQPFARLNPSNEGCDTAVFRFFRLNSDLSTNKTITYDISGSATFAADFLLYPPSLPPLNTITIPAGQQFADLKVAVFEDNIIEPDESVVLTITNNISPCTNNTDSLLISDVDSMEIDTIIRIDCMGDTVVIQVRVRNGSGDFGYVWTDSTGLDTLSRSAVLIISPDSLTMLIVQVLDSCTGEILRDTIHIPPIIPVTITGSNDTVVCGGTIVSLFADAPYPAPKYKWEVLSPVGYPLPFLPNDTSNTASILMSDIPELIIRVTLENEEVCPEDKIITIKTVLKGVLNRTPVYLCRGDSVQLRAYGGVNYQWTPSVGLSNDTISNPWTKTDTSYTVTITDSINCVKTVTIDVVIDTIPHAYAGEDVKICARSETQLFASGSDYNSYEWSPKESLDDFKSATPKATPIQTTTYYLKAKNNACFAFDSVTVFVIDSPVVNFGILIDSCERIIRLQNLTQGTDSIFWDFGDGNTSLEENPTHIYDTLGNYAVTLLANRGTSCTDQMTKPVNLAEIDINKRTIPNVFTPNDDGINEIFTITGGNVHCIIERISIFNRWGKKLFETSDKEKLEWDGKVGGQTVTPGVYFYVIEGKGFKDTGTITVIR